MEVVDSLKSVTYVCQYLTRKDKQLYQKTITKQDYQTIKDECHAAREDEDKK